MSEGNRSNVAGGRGGAGGASTPPQTATLHAEVDAPALSSPPAPAPRDVTPAASRRAWHEPRVHFWWIIALGLVAAAAWLAVQHLVTWNREASLIRSGTKVDAVVWLWGARVEGRPIGPEDVATLEFEWKGQPQVLGGQRLVREVPTFSGETIPVYVDPDNPRRWTARAAPPPLGKLMIGSAALVVVAALLAAVSVFKRRGVIATWRDGEARRAVVVETSQSALAPRSRLVRCALTDGGDKRLIHVYVPHRAATLQKGDPLWLIMPPERPDKALAAVSFAASTKS
ncbi:MAG TPA: hypothetical protein VGR35_19750 [Tepidisphaeraceae bacterium]|nr:hypothetical protein [Tepidisphaeraceae bacterium]